MLAVCAVYNPDYIKWVDENIHNVQYERWPGVVEVGWNELAKKASMDPVVVMVTQATVSRCSIIVPPVKEAVWGNLQPSPCAAWGPRAEHMC